MRTTTALIATALLLTGCGSSDSHDNKPKSKPKPKHTAISNKQQYLTSVRAAAFHSWTDKGPTDEELLDYPTRWCTSLAAGHSIEWMFSVRGGNQYPIGWDWGTDKADAQELVLLAVKVYCPKYRGQVVQELRAGGEY